MDGCYTGSLIKCPCENFPGLSSSAVCFWRNSFTHLVPLQGGNVVESNLSVLTPLGLESLVKQTTMSYPPASWKRMRRELDHAGVGQNYVVIQPTARQIFKCWDNAKFSAVIDALHARGYEVVLTSGPDKDDLACVNEIAQGCQTPPVTALAGKVTFPELGALIDHAQLFIGVDSAPAHIAAAVNTPLISLFGATDHIFWRPWSNNMIQFWAEITGKCQRAISVTEMRCIFRLFRRQMSLLLSINYCPPPRQVRRYDRCFLFI